MQSSSFDSTCPTHRRGVSLLVAFAVVALAVFAVLGIALVDSELVEREFVHEAAVTIRVVSTPTTEPITKLSPREVRAAVFGLLEHTPADALTENSPAGAADAGTNVPAEGELSSSFAMTRDQNACLIAVRSANPDRLAERVNDAARRFVELRNAAAANSAESDLTALRKATATRRNERDALAQALVQLERQQQPAAAPSPVAEPSPTVPADRAIAPGATPRPSQAPERAFNPQWVSLRDEVAQLEARLAELRNRFTDEHPEVQHAAVALAERTRVFESTPQYIGSAEPAVPSELATETLESPAFAAPGIAPAASPLNAPQTDAIAHAPSNRAELEAARVKLAAADAALDDAWNAENAASRRQIELAANGPWRFDAAESVSTSADGTANAPWLLIAAISVAAGIAASVLARGLRPVIETVDSAATVLGVQVIGVVKTESPLPPRPADPGHVSARWLVRASTAVLFTATGIASIAVTASNLSLTEVGRDPSILLSASRDWLATRID